MENNNLINEQQRDIHGVIHRLFHIHNWKPILRKYVSFNSRDILYECRCGKRKIVHVNRSFDREISIETNIGLTHKEMQEALLNGV